MSRKHIYIFAALATVCLGLSPLFGVGPSFKPDGTIKGPALTGWHTLGQADWKAVNGEVTGTAKAGGSGGWLVSDKSLQDAGVNAYVKCGEGCKAGVLFRAEKVSTGWKGVFYSLAPG